MTTRKARAIRIVSNIRVASLQKQTFSVKTLAACCAIEECPVAGRASDIDLHLARMLVFLICARALNENERKRAREAKKA